MAQSATDPTTGTIDYDLLATGISASDRRAQDQLGAEIKQLLLGGSCTASSCLCSSTNAASMGALFFVHGHCLTTSACLWHAAET